MKNTIKLRKSLGTRVRNQTIEQLQDNGTVVVGSPRTVREKINIMRERTGLQILVAMLQFGVLNDEMTKRNMELFASEVMPYLRT